jgi:uncharacterized protein YbbC (DUF1343 family)
MSTIKPALIAGFIFFIQSVCCQQEQEIITAAELTEVYFPKLLNKRIALVGNQTSMVKNVHLLDTMLKSGINVKKIFCPEHGFRGNVSAGETVKNSTDPSTGILIISLYGKHYKPKPSDLSDIDVVLFDIQDVGVRCYTYLSTLHYVMEACAENGKKMILLDRPNPNGFYIDGPILNLKYKSYAGLNPVPLVYGMTIGEYALMINGEKWLKDRIHCDLEIIQCKNYTHHSKNEIPVKPSPNLPNMKSVYLYPSLALFEGTVVNVGRGTEFPFQVFGHPELQNCNFTFTPKSLPASKYPLHRDTMCFGIDLRDYSFQDSSYFTLKWLIFAYNNYPKKDSFFNSYFLNLSGNNILINQIKSGLNEEEIKNTWQQDFEIFKIIRSKYLLYK